MTSGPEATRLLPVLPLRNTALFPSLLLPLSVGREASIAAVRGVLDSEDKILFVVAQKDAAEEEVTEESLYRIGTVAMVKRAFSPGDGQPIQIVVQGVERAEAVAYERDGEFLRARTRTLELPEENPTEVEAHKRLVMDEVKRALELLDAEPSSQLGQALASTRDALQIVYLVGSILNLTLEQEQSLLEAPSRIEALQRLRALLLQEIQVLEVRRKIATDVQSEMTKQQREFMLRQQMKAIQDELGEIDPQAAESKELRDRLDETELPDAVKKEVQRSLERLERLPPAAPDHQVTRTHLELILELPWSKRSEDRLDLVHVSDVLNRDHHDLEEVKRRILEHLAVLKLNPAAKAPILCFVGPPGVGKTSLGQSIANALGRTFERMSLGGLHDEAELRGHRRTYVGAMPGRILQAIRRAGVNNPLMMLDEVDKLGRDFRGDPAAALLEILDPEQNATFRDNYLDLPFDLSKVFFVCTANTTDTLPAALLDRMEMLRLSGYTEEEKLAIAQQYLVPRQLSHAGLTAEDVSIPAETLREIVANYTREAGVRQLERAIGRIIRRMALRFAEGAAKRVSDGGEPIIVRPEELGEILGTNRFIASQARTELPPGVAAGLAWTESGGEVLYVEATLLPGGKGLNLTGQLGEIMQESAKAARSYLWAHARELGLEPELFQSRGAHIHVPAGAVPKDGPSAGVAMTLALASAYANKPLRADTAMTGEISLAGLVLPVGGIKEKVLAARRSGIRRVILPRLNELNTRDLPAEVRADTEFVYVDRAQDALNDALFGQEGTHLVAPASPAPAAAAAAAAAIRE
ncbi:MAG: endopeptidase La [Gemmatimonadetes bacterium]|nr:endopeptidase La [Gemmatimonadota bacterium]